MPKTTIVVMVIKNGGELPPTPADHKLSFSQGIKSVDAARSTLQRAGVSEGYLLARHERVYWFEKKVQ